MFSKPIQTLRLPKPNNGQPALSFGSCRTIFSKMNAGLQNFSPFQNLHWGFEERYYVVSIEFQFLILFCFAAGL